MIGLLSLSAGLLAAGVVEGARHRAALQAVPIRIHVNGTRGKSTVTRLITGSLQAAGVRTLGKVTGTVHRWLLPDGSEEDIARPFAVARIHEQLAGLRKAARLHCTALVAECMAVQPELQWVSEHRMMHSTIGVITNARLDHEAAMGRSPRIVARTLANTVPERALLVCGDPGLQGILEPLARELGTRLIPAREVALRDIPEEVRARVSWHHPANLGMALAVTDALQIDRAAAWRGMAGAQADPGTASCAPALLAGGGHAVILDATAANDPESAALIIGAVRAITGDPRTVHAVYHHRSDRMDRLVRFGRFLTEVRPSTLWCSGDEPAGDLLSRLTERQVTSVPTPDVALQRLGVQHGPLETTPGPDRLELIIVCGNTRGARAWQHAFGPWSPVPLGEGRDRR